ncbi:MAG: hypothetical protein ACP5N1_02260 [Candidatus Woesearchaeota archaeon]
MPEFNNSQNQYLNEIIILLNGMSISINNNKIIYSEEFSKDSGVYEGYTLKEHILFVLNQFSKYDFYDNILFPEGADKDSFRLMLVLHDIGKPFAISSKGHKDYQEEYNKIFVKDILTKLDIKNPALYSEIISEDILGKYLKGNNDLNQTINKILLHANNCKTNTVEFYTLLKIYYMCDAGSYTKDSGGIESLDWLFIFDKNNRKILFSDKVNQKIQTLNKSIIEHNNLSI